MKKITLILFSIILIGCTDDNAFTKGKQQLQDQGYTDIKNTGYSYFCCSKDDMFSTGFSCKSKDGRVVEGCFCSSPFKGLTIRFK